jgi:hypothetical protein
MHRQNSLESKPRLVICTIAWHKASVNPVSQTIQRRTHADPMIAAVRPRDPRLT